MSQKSILKLVQQTQLELAAEPGKTFEVKGHRYAGLAVFKTNSKTNSKPTHEGLYRISLGSKAWVDVVDPGKKIPEPTASFEAKAQCDTIFKVVSFKLKPSHIYILEISSAAKPSLPLLLTQVAP